MIEINLVPEQLQKKKRKAGGSKSPSFSLPREVVVGMVGGFFLVLLCLHVALQVLIAIKYMKHKQLKAETETMSAIKQKSDTVLQELRQLQNKLKDAEAILQNHKIVWAQKLNDISDSMARGVWLNKLALVGDTLILQGSAASKDNSEILSVHQFTSQLKNNARFIQDFSGIEMAIHKTQKIDAVSIADFSVEAIIKEP